MRNSTCLRIAFGVAILAPLARGDEEACSTCGGQVQVSGQFSHNRNNAKIKGAAPGDEAAFREEIAGNDFTVGVTGLPAGHYS